MPPAHHRFIVSGGNGKNLYSYSMDFEVVSGGMGKRWQDEGMQ